MHGFSRALILWCGSNINTWIHFKFQFCCCFSFCTQHRKLWKHWMDCSRFGDNQCKSKIPVSTDLHHDVQWFVITISMILLVETVSCSMKNIDLTSAKEHILIECKKLRCWFAYSVRWTTVQWLSRRRVALMVFNHLVLSIFSEWLINHDWSMQVISENHSILFTIKHRTLEQYQIESGLKLIQLIHVSWCPVLGPNVTKHHKG